MAKRSGAASSRLGGLAPIDHSQFWSGRPTGTLRQGRDGQPPIQQNDGIEQPSHAGKGGRDAAGEDRARARLIDAEQRLVLARAPAKRAKKTVDQFGKDDTKAATLAALADIDHRIATMGEAVNDSIAQVEALFAASHVEETTDALKIKAATRAIGKRAPFHKSKNSIDDAILIETLADVVAAERGPSVTFAFVTDNHHDFSGTDRRHPHPDIEDIFKDEDVTFSADHLSV